MRSQGRASISRRAFGVERVELLLVVEYMQAFSLCIGLWGLMYYLAYILTGSDRFIAPLAIFYSPSMRWAYKPPAWVQDRLERAAA